MRSPSITAKQGHVAGDYLSSAELPAVGVLPAARAEPAVNADVVPSSEKPAAGYRQFAAGWNGDLAHLSEARSHRAIGLRGE